MRDDNALDLTDGWTRKAIVGSESHGLEPELSALASSFHMDVRRLRPFIAIEEEAIGTNPQHGGRALTPTPV